MMFKFWKNDNTKKEYFCDKCGKKKILTKIVGERFCLHCAKKTNSKVYVSVFEKITAHDSFGLKKKSPGIKGYVVKIIGGWFASFKYKDGVDRSMSIDREKNEYHEIVKDYKTGKIVHETHEKLSDHFGHGSAKHKKPNG